MSQHCICITDDDRRVTYELLVNYDVLPADPSVGLGRNIEIANAKLFSIETDCGESHSVTGNPYNEAESWKCGDWCIEKYAAAIEAELERFEDARSEA